MDLEAVTPSECATCGGKSEGSEGSEAKKMPQISLAYALGGTGN